MPDDDDVLKDKGKPAPDDDAAADLAAKKAALGGAKKDTVNPDDFDAKLDEDVSGSK